MFSSFAHLLRLGASGCQGSSRSIATIVSGIKTSKLVRTRLKEEVETMSREFTGFRPGLTVVQVGNRDDSNLYISTKLQAAAQIGIVAKHVRLSPTATQDEVLQCVMSVNDDTSVHGLIVQLPLDHVTHIDTQLVTNAVSPLKDVDGSSPVTSCSRTGVSVAGKHAVVIGRSKIVGAPMHDLLLWSDATVTSCHSKTTDLPEQIQSKSDWWKRRLFTNRIDDEKETRRQTD
ncbi:hypothetical protein F2P81_024668 [Scophthalmus maximus]|uniref:methenyltetrahydrofolate cyclohydrolase n=1 Tax=Scophthalmus maximus TaxID=52904 RepID=A0A6A4RVN1_SCOMX|nr:hypothetical protein F2P81_024668 [Scophthalmus maximus]